MARVLFFAVSLLASTVLKDITDPAFETLEELLQRDEGDVLLPHFHPMQRRGRNAELARVNGQGQLSALLAQEPAKLLLQGRCHGRSVRRWLSRIWEMCLTLSPPLRSLLTVVQLGDSVNTLRASGRFAGGFTAAPVLLSLLSSSAADANRATSCARDVKDIPEVIAFLKAEVNGF